VPHLPPATTICSARPPWLWGIPSGRRIRAFRTNGDRVSNRPAIESLIEVALAAHGTDHWIAVLQDAGVPCAPIQTVAQVIANPQTEAIGIMRRSADDALAFVGLPLNFDGVRPNRNEPVPELGADTAAILK